MLYTLLPGRHVKSNTMSGKRTAILQLMREDYSYTNIFQCSQIFIHTAELTKAM